MVDMTMISGTMTALKSASDLAKLMISSHDAGVIRQKAIELQTQILAAQSNALAAQPDQFTALERIRELEKQIADLKTWDTEKKRYELKIVARGSTV
jgi:ribosomal protein L29